MSAHWKLFRAVAASAIMGAAANDIARAAAKPPGYLGKRRSIPAFARMTG